MMDVWKDVVGHEGTYQVSQTGKVRSLDRVVVRPHATTGVVSQPLKGKLLRQSLSKGYPLVNLSGTGVKKVHRLVGLAWLDNPEGYTCINHIDSNKENNHVDNLEWCDHAHNNQHSYDSGTKGVGKAHQNYKHGRYSEYA